MTKRHPSPDLHEFFSDDKIKTIEDFYERFLSYLDVYAKEAGITAMNATLEFRKVPNMHSCPINGVCNFTSDPSKPTSYPGFSGTIAFFQEGPPWRKFPLGINLGSGSSWSFTDIICSMLSNNVNIRLTKWAKENKFDTLADYWSRNIASRSKSERASFLEELRKLENKIGIPLMYEIRMFCDDFPALWRIIGQENTFSALQNKPYSPSMKFMWSDPDKIVGLPDNFVKIY